MFDSNGFRVSASLGLLLVFVTLHILGKHSHTGRAIEAISHDWSLAEIHGLNVRALAILAYGECSLLAASAGVAIALEANIEPTLGLRYMLFAAAGSLLGMRLNRRAPDLLAALGGAGIGVLHEVFGRFVSGQYRDMAMGVLILSVAVLSQAKRRPRSLRGKLGWKLVR
jgi:branched-chain amino acid transport system permease protein